MNIKEALKNKKIQYGITGVIVILIIVIVFAINEMNKVKIAFELNDNVVEYGSDSKTIDWEKVATTNGNKITTATFDTKTVGQVDVTFTVCMNDVCKDFTQQIEIKDTQPPEIKLKEEKLEIMVGDEFDPMSNIESVKDPIDGDMKKSDDTKITKDGYIITSEVKTDKVGDYTVTVTAFDKNENKIEKTYKVTVKEKPEETPSQGSAPINTQGSQPIEGNQSSNSGDGNTVQEQPHYRTDIANTYFAQINAYRQQNGLPPLPNTAEAQQQADRRAMELISNYAHDTSIWGENIGMGTAGYNFFEAWKQSPGHNAAMLEESMYDGMAVSVVEYNGQWYAVTVFHNKWS